MSLAPESNTIDPRGRCAAAASVLSVLQKVSGVESLPYYVSGEPEPIVVPLNHRR